MENTRYSGIELLRIIVMIMIVMHHFVVHGEVDLENLNFSVNKLFLQIFSMGGKIGVDVFVLITGYFGIEKIPSINKIIKQNLLVTFYSVNFIVLLGVTGIVGCESKKIWLMRVLKSIFPIPYQAYGFVTAFVLVYIFSFYFNQLIMMLTKKQFTTIVIGLICIWGVCPVFFGASFNFMDNELIWFVVLYFTGAYLKKYPVVRNIKIKMFILFSNLMMAAGSIIFLDILGEKWSIFRGYSLRLINEVNSVFALGIAISLLLVFAEFKIQSHTINQIARCTFGIFLIHDNVWVRDFLWKQLFRIGLWYESKWLMLFSCGAVAVVFLGCLVIEMVRLKVLDKFFETVSNNISTIILNKYDAMKL